VLHDGKAVGDVCVCVCVYIYWVLQPVGVTAGHKEEQNQKTKSNCTVTISAVQCKAHTKNINEL